MIKFLLKSLVGYEMKLLERKTPPRQELKRKLDTSLTSVA